MSGDDTDGVCHPPKAYKNDRFLNSSAARELRILSEYAEPASRFRALDVADTVVFFGSARVHSREEAERRLQEARDKGRDLAEAETALAMSRYYEDARELARRLTKWSKQLKDVQRRFIVCSGGGPGIMEAANRGASEANGLSAGLGISLPEEQSNNGYITEELSFEFHYFFMRKLWFVYLARAVVVFPGGFGTLNELFEVLMLRQTGKMRKKIPIVLYGGDFWKNALDLNALVRNGTVSQKDLSLLETADSVDAAFDIIVRDLRASIGAPQDPSL